MMCAYIRAVQVALAGVPAPQHPSAPRRAGSSAPGAREQRSRDFTAALLHGFGMGDGQHSGFCFPLLPLAQDGIHRLHAIFNRFRSRVEFVQQATGTQFGKRVDGNNGIAAGFQRVDEVAQKRSVVAKPDNTRQLGFSFSRLNTS